MSEIRAVRVAPGASGCLSICKVPAPQPDRSEAVVAVRAFSLNLGEVRRAQSGAAGDPIGWDLAGTVVASAADGSGPAKGARVVGVMLTGGWSERVAVPTKALAELPKSVSFEVASTLPVAGLTAWRALTHGGFLLGRRVLVTGASGGVGLFGCQLARAAGAHVTGLVRRQEKAAAVAAAGAHVVLVGEDAGALAGHGPFDLVLESVGGRLLGGVMRMLTPDGLCVSYGVSAGAETTLDARDFFRTGRARYYGLYLFTEFGLESASLGLRRLLALADDGRLKSHVDMTADWNRVGEVAQALLDRRVTGKAVLTLPG